MTFHPRESPGILLAIAAASVVAAWLIILRTPAWPVAVLALLSIGAGSVNRWATRSRGLDVPRDTAASAGYHPRFVRCAALSARALLITNGTAAVVLILGVLLGGGWV